MADRPLAGNPNLKDFVNIARALGCTVEQREGTGELRFTHPAWPRSRLVNLRRKDTPQDVLAAVRRLAVKGMP